MLRSLASRTVVAAVALACLATACASESSEDAGGADRERVRFLLGFVIQGVHAPWIIGQEKGFFEEEGIELELVQGEAPSIALAGLSAGEGEFASVDLIGLALAKKENPSMDVRLLASTYNKSPFAFYSLAGGANIRTLADLEGATIHVAAGTVHRQVLSVWLAEHGIEDVTFKDVDPASRDQLLIAGKVPVISSFISNGPAMKAAAQESGDELVELRADDAGLGDYMASGVAARESWVEDHPDLARRFLAAYVKSFLYAFDNPGETADAMSAEYPEIPRENTITQLQVLEDLFTRAGTSQDPGRIDTGTVEHTISYVAESLGLEDTDPSTLYLEGYAP